MDRFQEMEIFDDVVARESFSATARARDLFPSGVSKLILRLERRLGILLFKRDTRRVTLTEEGRQYHVGVQRVLASMADLDAQNDQTANSSVSGHLSVMCSLPIMTKLLAPLIPDFSDAFPDLHIQFTPIGPHPLQSLDPSIDLGFYSAEMPSSSLIARKIFRTSHVICAAPNYLERMGKPSSPGDLVNHRCLNLSTDANCNHWPVQMPNGDIARLDIKPHYVADNSEMLYALVLAGAGIGRFASFQVEDDIRQGRLVKVLEDFHFASSQPVYAVYHSRRFLSRRIQVFLDFVEQRLARRTSGGAVAPVRLVSAQT